MLHARPQLISAKLEKLHPTQITVGKLEVALKRKQWGELGKKVRTEALASHWFPAILGPEEKYYILDHHHFGLALLEEGVKTVCLMLQKDLSWLNPVKFWTVMDHSQWVHPYGTDGTRHEFNAIPNYDVREDMRRMSRHSVNSCGRISFATAFLQIFLIMTLIKRWLKPRDWHAARRHVIFLVGWV